MLEHVTGQHGSVTDAATLRRHLNYSFTVPFSDDDLRLGEYDPREEDMTIIDSDQALPGLAVVVQQMVFGNRRRLSGTGVAYSRDPNTGEKQLFGFVFVLYGLKYFAWSTCIVYFSLSLCFVSKGVSAHERG